MCLFVKFIVIVVIKGRFRIFLNVSISIVVRAIYVVVFSLLNNR